jgi:hypothetical protein
VLFSSPNYRCGPDRRNYMNNPPLMESSAPVT